MNGGTGAARGCHSRTAPSGLPGSRGPSSLRWTAMVGGVTCSSHNSSFGWVAKERPAPEKPGRGVGGGRSGGGFGLGAYAGGGVEFGSEFDDAAGGARGLGVCGNPVLGPEMEVTLDAEAETAPEFQ